MRFSLVVLLLLAPALASCGGRIPLESTQRLTVVDGASTMPAPDRQDLSFVSRPALIGPLDQVELDVFNVPEISRTIQVDADGRIAVPLLGAITASGKTSEELSREIEAGLRGRYVRDPQVTINVKNGVSQVVTVDGQVMEPGLYPVTSQTTLMRTIASAKGLSEYAKLDDVVILRTVGGKRMAGLYNIGAIRRGSYDDPPIYANDVVVVGDSPQRRLFRDFVGIAPLLASPLLAVLQ